MDMEQKKLEVLSVLAAVLKDNRFDAKFMQGENGSLPLTRIDLPKKGKVGVDVGIEMCFIPMPMARPNTALLQVYVSVLSLPEIPRNCMAELKRAVFYCNDFCAIGQFGVFERAGQVYLRHNIILNLEDEMERIVTDICDYYSLVLASVDRFVDGLAQVATGVATLESAMDMGLFPTFNMEEEDNEMKL